MLVRAFIKKEIQREGEGVREHRKNICGVVSYDIFFILIPSASIP